MSEPDFEQLARTALAQALVVIEAHAEEYPTARPVGPRAIAATAAMLRQVWNARGDADIDLIQKAIGALDR